MPTFSSAEQYDQIAVDLEMEKKQAHAKKLDEKGESKKDK